MARKVMVRIDGHPTTRTRRFEMDPIEPVQRRLETSLAAGFQEIWGQLGEETFLLLMKELTYKGHITFDQRRLLLTVPFGNLPAIHAALTRSAPPPRYRRQWWPPKWLTLAWVEQDVAVKWAARNGWGREAAQTIQAQARQGRFAHQEV